MNNEPQTSSLESEEDIIQKIKTRKNEITTRLVKAKNMPLLQEFTKGISEFTSSLKEQYSQDELNDCKLYHAMTGSSHMGEEPKNFDLQEGEIRKFLENHFSKFEKN